MLQFIFVLFLCPTVQGQRCPLPFSLTQKSLPTSRRRHKRQRLPGIISINTANFWQRCANDKVPTGNGRWGVDPPTHTHTHSPTEHAYKYTKVFFSQKSPFWLCSAEPFGLFSTAAAVFLRFTLFVSMCVCFCISVCVLLLLFFEKSLVIVTSQPAVFRATRQAQTFYLFYVSPSEGGARCSATPMLTARFSQLFWAPSTAAEQFWGLTLTRLRHTRARTLKVSVGVRPTTRTRHLDECCLLSLGFGV